MRDLPLLSSYRKSWRRRVNTTYFTPKAEVSSTASKREKRATTTEWKAPLKRLARSYHRRSDLPLGALSKSAAAELRRSEGKRGREGRERMETRQENSRLIHIKRKAPSYRIGWNAFTVIS